MCKVVVLLNKYKPVAFFAVLIAVVVAYLPVVVFQKFSFHGNVTSHFFSILEVHFLTYRTTTLNLRPFLEVHTLQDQHQTGQLGAKR